MLWRLDELEHDQRGRSCFMERAVGGSHVNTKIFPPFSDGPLHGYLYGWLALRCRAAMFRGTSFWLVCDGYLLRQGFTRVLDTVTLNYLSSVLYVLVQMADDFMVVLECRIPVQRRCLR